MNCVGPIFFRTLRPGQTVFVLGPKYDPSLTVARLAEGNDESRICDENVNIHSKSNQFHIMKAKIGRAYLLLGRDLEGLSWLMKELNRDVY